MDKQTDIFQREGGLENALGVFHVAGQEFHEVVDRQQCSREKNSRLAAIQRHSQHGGWIQTE